MFLLDPVIALVHGALVTLAAQLPGPPGAQLLIAFALITLAVRAVMIPLAVHSHRRRKLVVALQPQVDRVRRKHRQEPERLARELRQVYARAGVSPFAGMGGGLLQSPLLVTLYGVATVSHVNGVTNVLATTSLLGTPLSATWAGAVLSAPLSPLGLGLLGLLLAIVLVAGLSARAMTEGPALLRLLPYGTVVAAVVSPIALSAYLLSTTTWSLAERAALARWA